MKVERTLEGYSGLSTRTAATELAIIAASSEFILSTLKVRVSAAKKPGSGSDQFALSIVVERRQNRKLSTIIPRSVGCWQERLARFRAPNTALPPHAGPSRSELTNPSMAYNLTTTSRFPLSLAASQIPYRPYSVHLLRSTWHAC